MAFTFTNYAGIQPQESPWNDIFGKILSGYTDMTKAKYLQPGLEEELKKSKLYNQYYGPEKEALIKLHGAQTGLAGAHAGLIGQQTIGERFKNQYLPEQLKAQLKTNQLKAREAQMFNQMLQQKLSGNIEQPNNMAANVSEYNPGEGAVPFSKMMNQQIQQAQPQMQQMNPTAMQEPQPTIEDIINKKYFNIDTFGPKKKAYLDIQNQHIKNAQEEEKAFKSMLGKRKAEFYDNSVKSEVALGNQDLALEELQNAATTNPQFRNVVGPINKPLSYWLGTPEQKKLLGTLESSSGEIALQVAPSLKGAFTGRDQTLINQIKASPRDPADVFLGKLAAQRLINSALKDRARLQSQFIEQGYSQRDASLKAAKLTPLQKYQPKITELINPQKNNKISEPVETKGLSNEQLMAIAGMR